jgi:hypothetical protein
MEHALALHVKYTPEECFQYWKSHIHPDHTTYVKQTISKMISDQKALQIEFQWCHPKLGDVMVRFSGKRVNDADGMVILEGYYRIINDAAHSWVMQ